jgi:hypothetical protein
MTRQVARPVGPDLRERARPLASREFRRRAAFRGPAARDGLVARDRGFARAAGASYATGRSCRYSGRSWISRTDQRARIFATVSQGDRSSVTSEPDGPTPLLGAARYRRRCARAPSGCQSATGSPPRRSGGRWRAPSPHCYSIRMPAGPGVTARTFPFAELADRRNARGAGGALRPSDRGDNPAACEDRRGRIAAGSTRRARRPLCGGAGVAEASRPIAVPVPND